MDSIAETDLILNADGSAYHLNLLPHVIANTIITVGDPDRVPGVSKHFDRIELKKGKREFITHTGYIDKKRLSVISTGIGTDNIDIVLNELDALVNIDLKTRLPKAQLKSLDIVRIGTSGAIQADIEVDTLLASSAALGLDPLIHYYRQQLTDDETSLLNAFTKTLGKGHLLQPYLASANQQLLDMLAHDIQRGITITAPGFYAPQGRQVRAISAIPNLMRLITGFNYKQRRITNLEMETAGIYGLAAALGHRAISFNVILANRATNLFSTQPQTIMGKYITMLMERIAALPDNPA